MGAVGFTAAGLGSVSRWCGVSGVSVVSHWCFGGFGGVSMVFRWCLGGVSLVSVLFRWCLGGVSTVSRWWSRWRLGGVSVASRLCRWGLGRVGGVLVFRWCVDDVSVVSWWCLSGFHVDSRCSRCFGRILVASCWACEKCNVVWYPIRSIDQSPWSLSFAGHFCWGLIPHCQPFGGPSGKSKIHSTMATSDSRIATRCRGPQISNGPSLVKTTRKTPMVPGSIAGWCCIAGCWLPQNVVIS